MVDVLVIVVATTPSDAVVASSDGFASLASRHPPLDQLPEAGLHSQSVVKVLHEPAVPFKHM